ncbi:uncharacterized protein JKF63_07953 [Porcisia hertigi]|uniref:PDZ domain-containing protein n=1 Tax=Porcisia hertigi TaxID=2761500 RepID=A0A836HVF7_9TRYP|nr:hypothetical protein JKF63_07953 [Porcisia hertigi]
MSAPLTESDLFSALSGYASKLEVQLMIEEEVKRFQKTMLPQLLSDALGASPQAKAVQEGCMPSSSTTAVPSHGTVIPNSEWVQMFLKAHADDVLSRELPAMIALEVRRQLHRETGGAQVESAAAASSPSPPQGESVAQTATPSARAGLPPLPSCASLPPLAPLREATGASAEASPAGKQGSVERGCTSPVPTPCDEGRRQREQILNAIADMEHELKDMQRDVDRVSQQQKLSRCRFEYLCEVLQGTGSCLTPKSELSTLCVALEKALDDRQGDVVRARLTEILRGLLPPPAVAHPGKGAAVQDPATVLLSSRSSVIPQDDLLLCGSLTSVASYALTNSCRDAPSQPLPHFFSQLHHEPPSPSLGSLGGVGALPAQAAYASLISPVNCATRSPRILTHTRHVDATVKAASAGEHAAAAPVRALRSITTRGSAESTATAAGATPAPLASAQQPSASMTTHPTDLSSSPGLRQHSYTQNEASTAALPLAPLPQECIDSRMSKSAVEETRARAPRQAVDDPATTAMAAPRSASRARHSKGPLDGALHHGVSSPSTTAAAFPSEAGGSGRVSRAAVLGVDAVNLPSGLLPGVLGRRGAVRVQSLAPQELAERAGVCCGDVLLAVDHRPVCNCTELRDALEAVPVTQKSIPVQIYRQSIDQLVCVTLQL